MREGPLDLGIKKGLPEEGTVELMLEGEVALVRQSIPGGGDGMSDGPKVERAQGLEYLNVSRINRAPRLAGGRRSEIV